MGSLLALQREQQWDVLLASETHTRDHHALHGLAKRNGWAVVHAAREVTTRRDGQATMAKGGVAIILFNTADFILIGHRKDARGLVTAEIRARSGAFNPYLLACAYLPPAASTHAHLGERLLVDMERGLAHAQTVYGDRIILGGDFNARIRSLYGKRRFTEDTFSNVGNRDAGEAALSSMLEYLNMEPVAGATAARRARVNSRAVTERGPPEPGKGTEVCFLCAPRGAANVTTVEPGVGWEAMDATSSHTPQAIAITMTASTNPAPVGTPTRAARLLDEPDYCNAIAWDRVAREVGPALSSVASQLSDRSGYSTAEAVALWTRTLGDALGKAIPPKPVGGARGAATQTWRPPGPGGAAGEKARAHREALRRREAADFTRNRQLPPDVVELILEARRTGSEADRRAVRAALRAHNRAIRDKDVWGLNELRRCAPRKLFNKLAGVLAPADPTAHDAQRDIPSEQGKDPPLVRMVRAFKERLERTGDPPPATALGGEWLRWVREAAVAPASLMDRPIAPCEVARVIWGADAAAVDAACPASGVRAAAGECPVCNHTQDAAEHWRGPGDLRNVPPVHQPRLKPQKGVHGTIKGTHLSWGRPLDWGPPGDRGRHARAYRTTVASSIATLLNRFLEDGTVPLEVAENLSVPVFKEGSANKADPDSYRFTAMTCTLLKAMDLVLTARLTHHVARTGAVSGEHQGAFTAGMGGDWHPWAAAELVKDAWRGGRNVFLLFIDFKKAYDKVHPAALLAVLERQGVPARIRRFISGWFAARTTRVRVNGETTDPIATEGGVGQGFVISPMLFSLFINSLARFLKHKGVAGVRVGLGAGTYISSLFFADDICCPCESPEEAQRVARLIEEWCEAWGMEMNVGVRKTAVLPMLCPAQRAHPDLQPGKLPKITLRNGDPVPYCTEYKYLGYDLTGDLGKEMVPLGATKRRSGAVEATGKKGPRLLAKLLGRLRERFGRYFFFNKLTPRMPPAAKLQIASTVALGAYLVCAIPPTKDCLDPLDAEINKMGRAITGLGNSSPNTLASLMSGLPTATFVVWRERLRLWLGLQATRHMDAPAPRVFAAVGAAPGTWRGDTEAGMARFEALGARTPQAIMGKPAGYAFPMREVTAAAVATAREYADVEARERLGAARDYTLLSQPWEQLPPVRTLCNLLLGGAHTTAGECGLHRATPVSRLAVRGGGALVSRVNAVMDGRIPLAVALAWEGPMALAFAPLGPECLRLRSSAQGETRKAAARGRDCTLCKGGVASPEHIINACTGVAPGLDMGTERRELRRAAQHFITRLARLLRVAQGQDEADAARAADALDVGGIDWDSHTGKAMLHRLLVVAPWPRAAVDDAGAAACGALGGLFDDTVVTNRWLRPVANAWVRWAGTNLLRVCGKWSTAVDAAEAERARAEATAAASAAVAEAAAAPEGGAPAAVHE